MNAMPSKDKPISRRTFLDWVIKCSLAGSALIGLGALMRYITYQGDSANPSWYDLGLAANYPPGSQTVISTAQAMIIHNEQGYSALSLVCPHLGCVVNVNSDGFTCPCHGSRFLPDGSLKNGPATHPLKNLRLEINNEGHLILNYD